jgi:hypothetical protein
MGGQRDAGEAEAGAGNDAGRGRPPQPDGGGGNRGACPDNAAGMACPMLGAVCRAVGDSGAAVLCACRRDAAGMMAWRCFGR